ncbi:MAG TPA: hypothetical protein VGP42_02150 [Stellaceae bacterium]|jgi:hypothetical protein|nr:hypothetical protein [Stellaceae bacterium]
MVLYLVKNNVPFDLAASLSADDLLLWSIVMGRFDGAEFDFERMRWKERR